MKRQMLLLAMLACVACERPKEKPWEEMVETPRPAEQKAAAPATAPDTVVQAPMSLIAVLKSVRIGAHEGYDRIVFEFEGGPPQYKLEYIDRPVRSCGSGDVVELPGDAWLSIRFEPANAHTDAGEPSVTNRDILVEQRNLARLKIICDFEAVVEWVAAVRSPGRFNVTELQNPQRIVVDIANR